MEGIQNIPKQFEKDLKRFYALIQEQSAEIQGIYKIFDKSKKQEENQYFKILIQICHRLGLEPQQSTLMAICDRIVNLKEGSIIQVLKKEQKSNSEILIARKFLLNFVSNFYAKKHEEILSIVQKEKLFNGFYREILLGVHQVGLAMNDFFESWQDVLIDGINKDMQKHYGDKEALRLLASSIDEEISEGKYITSDRSYSIPKKLGDKFISIPYALSFDIEIKSIIKAIEKLLLKLEKLEDEIYGKKDAYILYFNALKIAFGQNDKNKLIESWRQVDIHWMDIDTPFQIGHPLEYYEDRYRHSVAPEWDLRITNPEKMNDKRVKDSIISMFMEYAQKLKASEKLKTSNLDALKKVKFYAGLPALYYGADMNGLFSAQVVPNDEIVSNQFGKKIFAFGDKIIQASRNKPKMKLSYQIFEALYLEESREILFNNESLWHLVYDITTNGHEFGHILWIEEDTQRLMNIDGEFKNIEEFKATCGGLVAFFKNDYTQEEFKAVMSDTIRRAISLMAWKEQEDVLPYYCEGLIHLYGAFENKVIEFYPDKKPVLKINQDKYKDLVLWYLKSYESLAKHYMQKINAGKWLEHFVLKNQKEYISVSNMVNVFIQWYWEQYQEIGQEVL
ncbi:invasion protein CiaB [Helicobacter sp. 13S00477-4]|uniref:invasion protein CiaB n=1 Tax=Helicobacter sp. 13S00477-4 TaxID=1905759 RepID=UPI000BA639F5|nr:invasion protein CiaB [Helicobacter sp. 13S00477-4]PAF52669.1 hypothetical protein BKH44_00330 [Helicobacter sp. 13S00477-4]